jgi:ABC-2 type transport system ATP-binding protein
MEEAVVRVKGVTKDRGSLQLGPLDLDIPSGYVTAIVGSNGSGKSTLINMIMQVVHPDGGSIELFDHKIAGEHQWQLKQNIGYVPEKSWSEQDGETLERIAAFTRHWYPSWNQGLYERLVRLFEINPKQKFNKMSKGMRRKCEIILGIAHEPDMLILDEPSSGLDPFAWKMMMDEIKDYMNGGDRTVLLASHIVEEIKRLADYVVFMHKGKLLGMFEKDQLLDDCKTLWVEIPDWGTDLNHELPGVIAREDERTNVVKIVTLNVTATEQALQQRGWKVVRTAMMELDEIFMHLIQRSAIKK